MDILEKPEFINVKGIELARVRGIPNMPNKDTQGEVIDTVGYTNKKHHLSVMVSIDKIPGMAPFLHVSCHNHKRDLTKEEVIAVKELYYPKQLVEVVPTNHICGFKTFHMFPADYMDLGISPN